MVAGRDPAGRLPGTLGQGALRSTANEGSAVLGAVTGPGAPRHSMCLLLHRRSPRLNGSAQPAAGVRRNGARRSGARDRELTTLEGLEFLDVNGGAERRGARVRTKIILYVITSLLPVFFVLSADLPPAKVLGGAADGGAGKRQHGRGDSGSPSHTRRRSTTRSRRRWASSCIWGWSTPRAAS